MRPRSQSQKRRERCSRRFQRFRHYPVHTRVFAGAATAAFSMRARVPGPRHRSEALSSVRTRQEIDVAFPRARRNAAKSGGLTSRRIVEEEARQVKKAKGRAMTAGAKL